MSACAAKDLLSQLVQAAEAAILHRQKLKEIVRTSLGLIKTASLQLSRIPHESQQFLPNEPKSRGNFANANSPKVVLQEGWIGQGDLPRASQPEYEGDVSSSLHLGAHVASSL